MREEIEEVVTTEEYLNQKLEQEGKYSEVNNDKIEVSKVFKPKFTVTSYTMDPPIDRFRDSLYCLSSPVSSVASSPPDPSYISPNNDKYNFCDEKTDISSQSGKVPFPEFGVDLIRASPFNRKITHQFVFASCESNTAYLKHIFTRSIFFIQERFRWNRSRLLTAKTSMIWTMRIIMLTMISTTKSVDQILKIVMKILRWIIHTMVSTLYIK